MLDRQNWETWQEITVAVDQAYGLVLLADYDGASSIADKAARENARSALISVSSELLEKVAALLPSIEQKEKEKA